MEYRPAVFAPLANSGAAEHSQHMLAKAIDIRVPGVTTTTLRDAALSLHAGGVGYYPVNQFVHVDVGPVRQWQHGHGAGDASTRLVAKIDPIGRRIMPLLRSAASKTFNTK